MTYQLLQTFGQTLADMLCQAMLRIRTSAQDFAEDESLPPDIADRAAMESERNFAILMRERDRTLVSNIKDALARIESGEYGICEECGDDIALARLKARPMATLCVHCQALRESGPHERALDVSNLFQS